MSIRSKIQNLIAAGNEVTGNDDSTLTDVIQSLIDGYGSSSETKYSIAWSLTNVDSSTDRSTINENAPFNATLSGITGYTIDDNSVVITMSDQNITSTVYNSGVISIPSVTGNITITASATKDKIDLLNVSWANHAIACGQSTNNYNAWSPHNLQYDDVHRCFVFLQCHCDKHLNHTITNWTLSIINPYDATDVEDISTIPAQNRLGMLFIENGIWTIIARGTPYMYRSSDRGLTWETIVADTNFSGWLFGIYKCGNTYFAGNDRNSGITYFKSADLINWQEVSFDSNLGYDCLCETSFAEYDGYYWAFNRTNDSELGHPVILRSNDEGTTWTLFSDQMLHGWRSTISCYPFKNYLMVADLDRDRGILYYSKFDGETFEELNSWKVAIGGDDFHNVNIASNYEDTVILEFMCAPILQNLRNWTTTDLVCDNVMIVGSTKDLPQLEITYYDTATDVLNYLNSHGSSSIQKIYDGTLQWKGNDGGAYRLQLPSAINTFVDEVEFPLNFANVRKTVSGMVIKQGDHFVKPCNNPLLQLNDQTFNVSSSDNLSRIPYVSISGVRYAVNINESTFPVLTNANYLAPRPQYDVGTTMNETTGETWQAELPLRRVVDIVRSTTSSNLVSIGNTTLVDSTLHNFVEVGYIKVSSSN